MGAGVGTGGVGLAPGFGEGAGENAGTGYGELDYWTVGLGGGMLGRGGGGGRSEGFVRGAP